MTRSTLPPRSLDALTSLRFFAAAMVMLFHFWLSFLGDVAAPAPVALGYTGVSFFFVLSGFILAYTYERDGVFEGGGIGRYAIHRVARIWPVYLTALVIFLPFLASSILKEGASARLIGAVLSTPFALQAWVPGSTTVINYPGWSISTEVFFYLAFPFLVAPVFRAPERAAMLALAYMLATWTVESLVWLQVANGLDLMSAPIGAFDTATERVADVIRYFPPLRIGEFVLGVALCALWRKGRLPSDPRLLLGTAAGGAAAIVLLAEHLPGPALFNGASVIAWAPLVVWGANARGGWLTRPIFVLLGRISFALYLTHASIGYYAHAVDKHLLGGRLGDHPAVALVLVSVVSCLVAAVVFAVVEEPMRRRIVARWEGRKRRSAPVSARPQPVAAGDLRPAE